jgi:phage I-like protein
MENMIGVFRRRKNPIKVDYEHDSLSDVIPGFNKIAAGYIHDLEIRGDGWGAGDGLYGLVEFTARCADMVRSGEVRFNSPVIDPAAVDRKTDSPVGMELVQAAVTSDPFLDGQRPITLTREHVMPEETRTTPEQLPLANEPEAPTPLAAEIAADITSVMKKLGEMTGLDDAAVVAATMDKLEAIAKLIGGEAEKDGMPADEEKPPAEQAATRPVADAPAAPAPGAGDKTLQMALSRLDQVHTEVEKLKQDKQVAEDARYEREADELIAAGRCLPGEKADCVALLKSQPDIAARLYRHKRVPVGTSQLTREAPGSKEQTTFELKRSDELVIKNLVASGWKQKEAEDYILNKRSN